MLARFAPYGAAFLLLLTTYAYFIQLPGPNEVSRTDLVLALVHDGTTVIDRYHVNTFDKARFGSHLYTDKAIGASLLGLPTYVAYQLYAGWPDWDALRLDLIAALITITGVTAPTAALTVLLFWWSRQQGLSRIDAGLIAGGYGLATPAFPFATMLFGHQTAAAFLFAAFVLFWQVRRGEGGTWTAAAAGLATGLAVISDYPSALAILPFGLYLITSAAGRRAIPAVVAGGITGIAPLLVYNYASFGNPFRLAYEQIDDPESFAGATRGLFGVTMPTVENLVEILFGPAGLFSRAPFLLLAPFGLVAVTQQKRRAEVLVLAAVFIGFLAFNAAYYLPFGGVQTGPRFLLPAVPFLAALLVFCHRYAIRLIAPLIGVSAIVALALTAVRVKVPPETAAGSNDLLTYWLPRLISGDHTLTWGGLRYGLEGATGLLPLAIVPLAALIAWRLSRSSSPIARTSTLAVAAGAYLLVSAPIGLPAGGRVPVVFRQAQPLVGEATPLLRYGESIALLSTEVAPLDARLDSDLHVWLRWTALAPVNESYTVFIHVFDASGELIGQWDGIPGAGAYPTLLWEPGREVNDRYIVRLRRDVALPTIATVHVGLYRYATLERLTAVGPNGELHGDAPTLAQLRLPGFPITVSADTEPRAVFGDRLELLSVELDQPSSAGVYSGILRWRARAPMETSYHTSVQIIDPGGQIAQTDGRLTARYPTTAWQAGEIVEQPFQIELPAGTDPPWQMIVVVYDPATGQRLPTPTGDFARIGGAGEAQARSAQTR